MNENVFNNTSYIVVIIVQIHIHSKFKSRASFFHCTCIKMNSYDTYTCCPKKRICMDKLLTYDVSSSLIILKKLIGSP